MASEILYTLGDLLGLSLEASELGIGHMAARAILGYVVLLAIVRLGDRRLLDSTTAFDIVLGILIGSIASRGITGNAPYFPALGACAVLVALHGLFAWTSFRSKFVALLVKGRPTLLLRDGTPDRDALRKTQVTDHDLSEAFRMNGTDSADKVALAHIERNGKISVVEKRPEPRVVDVAVAQGVQTVRIHLG
jgi:uncharacterized membrane protein YcaP (DUF421 family)